MTRIPVDPTYDANNPGCAEAVKWFRDHGYGEVKVCQRKFSEVGSKRPGMWHICVYFTGPLPKKLEGYPRRFGGHPWRFYQNGVHIHLA
jgi:hypothetical protein